MDPSKKLRSLQKDYDRLEARFRGQLADAAKSYNEACIPLYERRRKIVNGEVEPTDEEKAVRVEGEEDEEEGEEGAIEGAEGEEGKSEGGGKQQGKVPKGIPQFWLTVLKNHVSACRQALESPHESWIS